MSQDKTNDNHEPESEAAQDADIINFVDSNEAIVISSQETIHKLREHNDLRFDSSEHELFQIIDMFDMVNMDNCRFIDKLKQANLSNLRNKAGRNILEQAIFRQVYPDIVWAILHNTDLNLTSDTRLCEWIGRGSQIYLVEETSMNPLLAAVKYEDFQLIMTLENRRDPGVKDLMSERTCKDSHAACFAITHVKNMSFFKNLLNYTKPLLTIPCEDSSPFSVALSILKPKQQLQKLRILTEIMCDGNTTCIHDLICTREYYKLEYRDVIAKYQIGNSLHALSYQPGNISDTLSYLQENGGVNCWRDKNNQNKDAYQIAKYYHRENIVDYYSANILPPNYKAREFLDSHNIDNSKIILFCLPLIGFLIGIVFFIRWIYKLKFDNSVENQNSEYIDILAKIVDTKPFDKVDYQGSLTPEFVKETMDNLNTNNFDIDVHDPSKTPLFYAEYPIDIKVLHVKIRGQKSGSLDQEIITPKHLKIDEKKITIYIPGTASIVERKDIDRAICSHLAFSLTSKVLIAHYELASKKPWPHQLNQVCDTILEYNREHRPTSINIAAYSIGGLMGILSILILNKHKHKVRFDRLILFAPSLDLGSEFRLYDFKEHKHLISHIPEHIKIKDHFHKPSQPFNQAVSKCFENLALKPKELRKFSPTWFNKSCFSKDFFPTTTFITGEYDFFLRDTLCLYEKLRDAGCPAVKIILPRANHFIMWRSIYPFYLAQKIDPKNTTKIKIDITELDELDEALLINKVKDQSLKIKLQRAKDLKVFCNRMNNVLITSENQTDDDKTPKYNSTL